jgi:hypothetical protein
MIITDIDEFHKIKCKTCKCCLDYFNDGFQLESIDHGCPNNFRISLFYGNQYGWTIRRLIFMDHDRWFDYYCLCPDKKSPYFQANLGVHHMPSYGKVESITNITNINDTLDIYFQSVLNFDIDSIINKIDYRISLT